MHTIVGLGNPGKEYENTRHNIGWLVLKHIIEVRGLPELSKSSRYSGLLSEGMLGEKPVAVLFPTTYMNNSGNAVSLYVKEKGSLGTLVVVHDDIDLPFGSIRVSFGRGAGGHNGVQSVIDSCGGKEFIRIRIGIAERGFFGGIKRPKGEELSRFVLKPLGTREMKALPEIAEKVDAALGLIIDKGVAVAMQECNK
jgi:PTH1 family peptidyl-tRNA hydrolase